MSLHSPKPLPSRPDRIRHRRLESLIWTDLWTGKPPFGGAKKAATTAQQEGLTFQKKAFKCLKEAISRGYLQGELFVEPWFEFEDANGPGFAQPDAYILPEDDEAPIILIECKLTQVSKGWAQMKQLYAPLLAQYYNRPILHVQAAKKLSNVNRVAMVKPWALPLDETKPMLWHFLGNTEAELASFLATLASVVDNGENGSLPVVAGA